MADEVRVIVDSQERRAMLVAQGGTGTESGQVQGAAADNAVASGNPVLTGGIFQTTPDTVASGDVATLRMNNHGAAHVVLVDSTGALLAGVSNAADGALNGNRGIYALANMSLFNGTTWDRARGNTTGLITIKPQGWVYAAATGGIDNSSTAVTIKAAAGAGIRNYLTSLQIDNDTLGAATEIAIRDGAGGTVLWRGKLQTAAGSRSVVFDNPIFSTANTLLEFLTVTAVTGDVLVNAQGYTAP